MTLKHLVVSAGFILLLAISSPAGESPVAVPGVKDLAVRAAMPDPLVADDGQKIATAPSDELH